MRLRKIVIGLGIVVVLGYGISTCGHAAKDFQPTSVTAERCDLHETVSVTGRVVASREVEIKCKASGAVLHLHVEEGAQVKQGDLLAELDPQDEQRSVERAELALSASQARLEQAQAAVTIAEEELASERRRATSALTATTTRHQDAADRTKRTKTLLEQGLVSAEEAAATETAFAEQSDALAAAKQRIDDLVTHERSVALKRSDIALAQMQVKVDAVALNDARQRLAETRVIAPISGLVSEVNVAEGQIVSSGISVVGGGTVIMMLAETNKLVVKARVDESDVSKIHVGQTASVTANALPGRTWSGKVTHIAAKGATKTSSVEFETKIALDANSDAMLRPEMTANVIITTVSATNAVLIPVTAMTWRKDKAYVKKHADGAEVEVTTGASDGEKIQIVKGIDAGESLRLPTSGGKNRWRRDSMNESE